MKGRSQTLFAVDVETENEKERAMVGLENDDDVTGDQEGDKRGVWERMLESGLEWIDRSSCPLPAIISK